MRRIQGRLWVSASELSASSPSTFMRLDELELEVILILSMLARARLADDLKTSSEATDSPETKALGLKMIFSAVRTVLSGKRDSPLAGFGGAVSLFSNHLKQKFATSLCAGVVRWTLSASISSQKETLPKILSKVQKKTLTGKAEAW